MTYYHHQVKCLILGGGMAGLSSGLALANMGMKDLLLVEKSPLPGGLLDLWTEPDFQGQTGGELLAPLLEEWANLALPMVLSSHLDHIDWEKKQAYIVSPAKGLLQVSFETLVLATGAWEVGPRGTLYSKAHKTGVFTSREVLSLAQLGLIPGYEIAIYGTTPVGFLCARILERQGLNIAGIIEPQPYMQCSPSQGAAHLGQHKLPFFLHWKIANAFGTDRIKGLKLEPGKVEEASHKANQKRLHCDALIFARQEVPHLPYLPDKQVEIDATTKGPLINNLHQTSCPWIFAIGDVVYLQPDPNETKREAQQCARGVGEYLSGREVESIPIKGGENIATVIPQRLVHSSAKGSTLYALPQDSQKGVFIELSATSGVLYRQFYERVSPGEYLPLPCDKWSFPPETSSLSVQLLQ